MIGLAIALFAWPTTGQEQRRGLGAHQHGHGTLNIAIDGPRLIMELDVPGADIVGFEHAPNSPEQKAAADRAAAMLRDPLSLFVLPAAAGCGVEDVNLELEEETDPGQAQSGGHADYRVEYVLACSTPAALGAIVFAYFDKFRGAEELSVNVVTRRGQGRFDVTRAAPHVELGRLN